MKPKVSVIIPSLDGYREGNLPRLLDQIEAQTFKDLEVILIKGIRPNGKARNIGAKKAKGEIIVCIDDDVTLGNEKVIEILVKCLEQDRTVGLIGASNRLPENSSRFQRRCAKEIPRSSTQIFNKVADGDFVDHKCLALYKELYFKIGMENENLVRGTDPDLRLRIREAGYRVALAPLCWIYHPMPKNLVKFVKMYFRNGAGSAWVFTHFPEFAIHDAEDHLTPFKPKTTFTYRIMWSFWEMFKALVTFKFFYFIARISYAFGYLMGYVFGWPGMNWRPQKL